MHEGRPSSVKAPIPASARTASPPAGEPTFAGAPALGAPAPSSPAASVRKPILGMRSGCRRPVGNPPCATGALATLLILNAGIQHVELPHPGVEAADDVRKRNGAQAVSDGRGGVHSLAPRFLHEGVHVTGK